MQETVDSVQSEVKRQMNEDIIENRLQKQNFDIVDCINKYTCSRELLSLWYPQVYREIFDSVDIILRSPLSNTDDNPEEVSNSLLSGVNNLVDTISSSDKDVQPLLNVRDRLVEYQDNEDDEITIVVEIHGRKSSITYYNQYHDFGVVTVNMNNRPNNVEESTLREYEGSLIDNFCSHTPNENRPTDRYKRELHISMKKTKNKDVATIDLTTERNKYTKMEKIFINLGFSSPYPKEPIKNLHKS